MREGDIVALFNHDSSKPLGRTSAGNLKLKATARGVEPELNPVDVSYGRDLKALVKAKVIRGWSFGFEVLKDTWTDDEGKESDQWSGTNRTIQEMRLIEVSPVTFPAYAMTDIASRDSVTAAREARGERTTKVTVNVRDAKSAKPFIDDAAALLVRAYNELNDDAKAQLPTEVRRVFERAGDKPYGDVDYADPGYQSDGKKRYPLDTKKHAQAAWSYINQADNRTPYTAAQLAHIEGKIKAAAKKFGITIDEENSLFLALEWRKHSQRFTEFGERRDIDICEHLAPATCECGTELACPWCAGNPDEHQDDDTKPEPERAEEESPETREDEPTEEETPEPTDTNESAEEVREENTSEKESRENAEPDDSTPQKTMPDQDALRFLRGKMISREVELGN
jgi:HK97 family phage prohead protease